MKKRFCLVLLVLLAIGLLAGCGSAGDSGASAAPAAFDAATAETVYRASFRELPDSGLSAAPSNGTLLDGALVFSSYAVLADQTPEGAEPAWPEQYCLYGPVLCRLTGEGALTRLPYTPVSPESGRYGSSGFGFERLCAADDGGLWVLQKENGAAEGGESYTLLRLDAEGNLLQAFPLGELRLHPEAAGGDGSYRFEITGMAADGKGRVCLALSESCFGAAGYTEENRLLAFGAKTGKPAYLILLETAPEQLASLGGGKLAVLFYENGSEQIGVADLEEEELTERFPVEGYPDSLVRGEDGLLYYSEGDTLFRLDPKSGETEKLFNWIDCDVPHSRDDVLCVLSDGTILALCGEERGGAAQPLLVSLRPGTAEAETEKTTLRLAVMNLDPFTSRMVSRFNREESAFRIEVTDYARYNDYGSDNEADWNAGLTRLQTEIIAGNVPDILDISLLSADRLGAKGLLEDLYPWLDADSELSRGDLLQSVLSAYEQNGKLYQTVSNFYLLTAVGLSERVDAPEGWTVEALGAAIARLREEEPESTVFENYLTRGEALTTLLYLEMGSFADWENAACYFDTPAFLSLLEFLNGFPERFDWANAEAEPDEDARLLSGRQLLKRCNLLSFRSVRENTAGLGGAAYRFVGYPTESGSGSLFAQLGSSFAISTACGQKEAAWRFVRRFFLPDYQEQLSGAVFPTNRGVYERLKRAETGVSYRRNPDGSFVLDGQGQRVPEREESPAFGAPPVSPGPVSEEEVALLEELIASTTHVLRMDESLKEIIVSGAAPYFAGQKSAEECAALIQSRASLYISEQR